MKIASRIGLSFFAVTVLCTVAALLVLYSIAKSNLQRSIEVNLESVAQSRTAHIETYLGMLKISVGQLSKSTTLEGILKITDKENLQQSKEFELAMTRLRRTKEANPSLYEFLLLDKTGKVIASSNEKNIGLDKSTDAYFLGGQKEIYIKDAYYLESINESLIAVSAPLSDSQTKELLGVLVATVKFNELWNITTDHTGLGETGEIIMVNKFKAMITPSRFLKDTILKQKADTEGVRQAFLHQDTRFIPNIFDDYRGVPVLGAQGYIPEMQWVLIAKIDTKEAFAPLAELRLIFLVVIFLTALAAWLLSRVIAKLIAGPIKKLHEGIEIIGTGNFNHKVGTDANDEVGQLSRAFDKMTENLKATTTSIENLNKEIAERKQAEEKLRKRTAELFEREEDLSITLRSIGDAMIATDTEGKITRMNPVAEHLTGWSLAEAAGKPLEDVFRIINAQTREPVQNPIAKVLASGQVVGLANHTALIARDGTVRQIADSAAPIRDAEGRIRGVVLVFHDVTAEYQINEVLRKKTEELEGFFTIALDLLCIADLEGNFLKVNKAWEDILGYPAAELEQRKFLEFVHPEDMQATLDAMAKLGEEKRILNFTNRYKHKDGNYRFIEWRSNPHGNLIYAAARDITERKKAEEELRFKNLLLTTQQEAAIDGILIVDGTGQIVSFNRRFVELWHIPQEVIASKSDQSALETALAQLKNPDEFMKRVRYLYEHQRETSREEIDLKDGRIFDRYSAPLIDNDGRYHGRVWFFRDITERRQAEQNLAQAKADLEKAYQQLQESFELETELAVKAQAASAAKSQFVANISHEIRTPLNGVIGICELLLETKMSNEQIEYAQIINSSAEALLNIINASLDFSKIEAGKMELEHIDFNLRNILEDIINVLAVNAANKKLEMVSFIEPNVPINLNGDPGRLRQILFNIIGNAIKFTSAGDITITAALAEDDGSVFGPRDARGSAEGGSAYGGKVQGLPSVSQGPGGQEDIQPGPRTPNTEHSSPVHLRFSVRDTGIGIPTDKTNLLFTAFSQVDASLARKFGGTGLGLAISKGLVEQMGGSIGVESVPGKGSTFWFIIPFLKQRADAQTSEPPTESGKVLEEKPGHWFQKHEQYQPGKRLRILVAEDNMANQMVILGILEKIGHVANAVADGKEVVKALETIPYDLVLMDLQMPEMDGLEATAVIRDPKSPVRDHNIPILALTAHTMPEDREQCMAAGMNGYITKPVSTKSVADALANIVLPAKEKPAGLTAAGYSAVAGGDLSCVAGSAKRDDPGFFPVFDSKAFSDRLSGDSALIREIINIFLNETPKSILELEKTIEKQQQETAARLAHTIKGSVANVSGQKLHAVARRIEDACGTADWKEAQALLPKLSRQFEMLERAMREYLKKAEGA